MKNALLSIVLAAASFVAHAGVSLSASSALVVDAETNNVLLHQADTEVRPIASITKLMTALVITTSMIDLEQLVTITDEDVNGTKLRGYPLPSPLTVGMQLKRRELLQLALMSSNNRAAHALARSYPGGRETFVAIMNNMAEHMGMKDTKFVEPTGLDNANVSTAHDLAVLVKAASQSELIRQMSTTESVKVSTKRHQYTSFSTTNRLIRNNKWHIQVQKTGFINDAGRCVVMMAKIAARDVIIVLLNAPGNNERAADADTIRKWLERQ